MQKITKASQVVEGEYYWIGNQVARAFKAGRWMYLKAPHWCAADTVQTVLRHSESWGAMYGPIPRPPEAERNGKD